MGEISDPGQIVVSVVIPVYERTELLGMTLDSIKERSEFGYEVIVVDDGSFSAGQIASIVEKSNHSLCRYIFQENKGAPSARNRGMQLAEGKYIKFLDSDDELCPNLLEQQALTLDNFDESAVCYSDWRFIGNTDDHRTGGSTERIMGEIDHPFKALLGGWWCASFSYLFNRKSLAGVLWDEELTAGQDFDFVLRVAEKNPLFIYKEFLAGGYRLGEHEQITHDQSASSRASAYRIVNGVEQRLNERGELDSDARLLLSDRLYDIGRNFYKAGEIDMARKCHSDIHKLTDTYFPAHVPTAQRCLVRLLGLFWSEKILDIRRHLFSLIEVARKR
jgi:glycosyltransferase involved in cell wall biosynthesis